MRFQVGESGAQAVDDKELLAVVNETIREMMGSGEMEKQRRRESLDFERRKMELDSTYDNYYYGWYPWW